MSGDIVALKGSGQILENVHPASRCYGFWCTIHQPMPGPWENWPMRFIANVVMVRICPCGYAHPCLEDILNGLMYADHDHYCNCECGMGVVGKRRDFGSGGTTSTP